MHCFTKENEPVRVIKINTFSNFFFKDFIYLFERENEIERESMRGGRVRERSRLPAEQGSRHGPQSQDPEIIT